MFRDNILKGLQISLGFIIGLTIFFGIVYSTGFHSANEIISGMFVGNYSFNGTMNFSSSTLILGDSSNSCSNSSKGSIMYNDSDKGIYVCNGFIWKKSTEYYTSSSCLNILDNGESTGDGLYNISPDGITSYAVQCNMTDGGWTLIFSSQTVSGSADQSGSYDANLATLSPSDSMITVWTPFDSVSEIKFECDGNKDGSMDYSETYTGNDIYSYIKTCSNGLCGFTSPSSITMDGGNKFGSGSADDTSANPDFPIFPSGGGQPLWGTEDDYPYSSSDQKDRCNEISYRTRGAAPTTGSTSNAYFYIYVK